MRTIMITGSVKQAPNHKAIYNVNIWAAKDGEQIEYIRSLDNTEITNYNELWRAAKNKVVDYYKEPLFEDGAYTQYLDHLISIK